MNPYYADSLVTIYHGDCREVLPSLSADLLLTDPPYGIGYEHGARKGGVRLGMDGVSIVGDDGPFDPSHLLGWIADRMILWGANHYADRLPASRGWLTWDKRVGGPQRDQSDIELAWTNFLTTARTFYCAWDGALRTGREQTEGRVHVNQKPVALMRWCIEKAVGVRSVIDPYAGSGSTLVAAREAGIPSIGIEIVEAHCEQAAERCRQGLLPLGGAA